MTIDEIRKVFDISKSKADACRIFGIDIIHQNGNKINKDLKYYADLVGYDLEYLKKGSEKYKIKNYYNKPKYCKCCGKLIDYEHKNNNFCSSSCSAKFNNKNRIVSDITKDKISKSLSNKEKVNIYRTCVVCGNTFLVSRNKNGRLSKTSTCSKECHKKLLSNKGKETYINLVNDGRFQGWKSRNKTSYAEFFWSNVLKSNNIDFKREYVINVDKNKRYFLDFYIYSTNKHIDLEIDGKQHKYKERIFHDKVRDEYISSKNIVVYRIEWNEINSDIGKKIMKDKINNFLLFYKSLL